MAEPANLDSLKLLRGLVVVTLAACVLVLLGSLLLPRHAHVERQVLIERPPHTVFTVLNGFRHFEQWSPWAALDPDMQVKRSGPSHGLGARYEWASQNASVGAGSQEIILSEPDQRIETRLEFSGMDAEQTASFHLEALEQGTRLTWALDVDFRHSLFGRYFGLLIDRVVGKDYDKGLSNLKTFIETLPETDFSSLEVEHSSVESVPIAFLSSRATTDSVQIAKAYSEAFSKIRSALALNGLKPTGAPLVIGRQWDAAAGLFEFDAAYPVAENAAAPSGGAAYALGHTYAGEVLKTTHVGPYSQLAGHFQQLMAYKKAMGFEDNGPAWDVYVTLASDAGPEGPVTETYIPIK